QPPRMQGGGRLGNGDHLSVGRGILKLLALIVGAGDYAALHGNNDGSDRYFVLSDGESRILQGHFHMCEMERVARIGQRQVKWQPLGNHAASTVTVFAVGSVYANRGCRV